MKWKSLLLPFIVVIIFGGLAGFAANLYFSQHPILITSGEEAYNVLRDVIMIVVAALTLFTAVLVVIVGWALRGILLHDLKSELTEIVEESKNNLCSNLHGKIAPLWGRLYEHDRKGTYLIDYAVDEARKAKYYADKLDKEKNREIQLMATNNYLMALAEKGDQGDANEAYRVTVEVERFLTKHKNELEYPLRWQETIYFARCCLPRAKSNDRENALQKFYSLKEHNEFEEWEQRWVSFGLITKDASPDRSS